MPALSVWLRSDAESALRYLLERWHAGAQDKRNATIQRALIEIAKQEGMK